MVSSTHVQRHGPDHVTQRFCHVDDRLQHAQLPVHYDVFGHNWQGQQGVVLQDGFAAAKRCQNVVIYHAETAKNMIFNTDNGPVIASSCKI